MIAAAVVAGVVAVAVAGARPSLALRSEVAAAAGTHECRAGQLAISFVRKVAVMGQEGGLLRFTNVGGTSCRISGYPRVVAITKSGRDVHASRSLLSMLFATYWLHLRPVPKLTLPHGRLGVRRARRRRQLRRQAAVSLDAARSLSVGPPGSRRQLTLSLGSCGVAAPTQWTPISRCVRRQAWVEPIRPRPRLSH